MKNRNAGKILITGAVAAATAAVSAAFLAMPTESGQRPTAQARTWTPSLPAASTLAFDSEASRLVVAAQSAQTDSTPPGSTPGFALEVEADGKIMVSADRATGGTSMVRVDRGGDLYPQGKSLPPADKVNAFLARHGAVFGITDAATQLRIIGLDNDQYGNLRVSYQQMHGDVPVFGAVMRGHVSQDGRLTAVNGKYISDIDLPQAAAIARADASQTAAGVVGAQLPSALKNADLEIGATGLYVYRTFLTRGTPGENHLAYEVEVRHGNSVREFVYVDAVDGKVVDQISGIHGVKDRRVYEGTYNPDDPETPPPAWKEGDPRPALDPFHEDEIAGAGESYNLFFNLSGGTYRSWDGNDAQMITVNNDPTIVCPNANWNGTSTNYCTGTSADDVVAHEWGHAYTQETSGLIYAWQSGALNESYSDIWGETVDLLNNREFIAGASANPTGDTGPRDSTSDQSCSDFDSQTPSGDTSYRWLMGEDAFLFAALPPVGDAAIRDMWHPTCFGDAGHVNSGNYHCSSSDAGGVHANSSIPNRAYAILVDGDSIETYDDGSLRPAPITINAIGLTKAAHIFWRANSVYNTPSTNFAENADNLELACADLIGVNLTKLVTSAEDGTGTNPGHVGENDDTIDPTPELSGEIITAADCEQVAAAIEAVEMRFDVTKKCGFKSMLDAAPAPMCGSAETLTFFNEDWEGGPGDWTTGQEGVTKATLDTVEWYLRSGDLPDNRDGSAHGGNVMFQENRRDLGNCTTDDESGHLWLESPAIEVHPTDPSQMMFEHYVNTEVGYDGGNVMISINGGEYTVIPASAFVHNPYNGSLNGSADQNTNPKGGEEAFHGGNQGEVQGDWGQSQIDLAAAGVTPGDTIRLRFDFGQDGCNGNDGWYVDQVELFSCGGIVNPPPKNCTTYEAGIPPFPTNVFEFPLSSVTTATVSGETEAITDVNIRNLSGSHTYMGDLTFELESPEGTSITLFDGDVCGSEDGINVEFDDDAASVIGCNDWTSGGTFKPVQALAAFNDEDADGDWTLTISDAFPQDSGQIDSWAVELCAPNDTENEPPTANDDAETTQQNLSVTIDVLANDSDPENDPLTVDAVTMPSNGLAFINDNMVSYEPNMDFVGVDMFQYTISDDHGNPASATVTVTVEPEDPEGDDEDRVKGSGKLNAIDLDDDGDSDTIDFHFDPKRKKDGELKGHLHLKDKDADVKIHMKDITYLGAVQGTCGMIDNGDSGTYILEFRGFGEIEVGKTKTKDVEFKACVVDADPLDSKGKKTVKGGDFDRFHLECITGCNYDTDDRILDDDVIDKGNIQVKLKEGAQSPAAGPNASAPQGGGSTSAESDGSASTVFLEPALLGEATVGEVELVKINVYDTDFRPIVGKAVSLKQTAPDGSTVSLQAVTGLTGAALFNVVIAPVETAFDVTVDGVAGNGIDVKPLQP